MTLKTFVLGHPDDPMLYVWRFAVITSAVLLVLMVGAGVAHAAPAGYAYERDVTVKPLLGYGEQKYANVFFTIYNYSHADTMSADELSLPGLKTTMYYDVMVNGTYANGTDNGVTYPLWIDPTSYVSNSAIIYINITDTIPNANYTLKFYWSKAGETSHYDASKVFPFFDDFDTLDTNVWTTSGSPSVSGGVLTVPAGSYIETKTAYAKPYAVFIHAQMGGVSMVGWESQAGTTNPLYLDAVNSTHYIWGSGSASSIAAHGQNLATKYNLVTVGRSTKNVVNTWFAPDYPISCTRKTTTVSSDSRKAFINGLTGGISVDWMFMMKNSTYMWSNGIQDNYIGAVNETLGEVEPIVPTASFTTNTTSGYVPIAVQFTDTSTGWPTSWAWDFNNDGTNDSTSQNPVAIFNTPGTYTVVLYASNANGTSTANMTITANQIPVPAVYFHANQTTSWPPMAVQYTDDSTGLYPATMWRWDMNGDGVNESTDQNPTVTYASLGVYTVRLYSGNAGGWNYTEKTDYITVAYQTPMANFTANKTNGRPPLTVQYNDTTTGGGIVSWEWDFGDGYKNSTDQNPVHAYYTSGSYNVSLTATNTTGGVSTITKTYYVNVTGQLGGGGGTSIALVGGAGLVLTIVVGGYFMARRRD